MKKRQAILLMAVLVAALSMASGAAFARDQTTAKLLNIVQCPNQPNNETCIGTKSGDHLVGGDEFENVEGKGGPDTYDTKGGGDDLFDASRKSSDTYVIPATDFGLPAGHGGISIIDRGGSSDVLDLSAYKSTDFEMVRRDFPDGSTQLDLIGSGFRAIGVSKFFNKNTIDTFKFSDKTMTAKQIKKSVGAPRI